MVYYRNVGTSTAPSFTLAGTNPFGLSHVGSNAAPVFVDLDSDGDLDLLIGNGSGQTVAYRNVGTSAAPSFTLVGTNPFGLESVGYNARPTVAEIDGDGSLDVMLGNSAGSTVVYLQGPPPPGAPSGLALAAASDSGVTGDRITNSTTPVITGSAASGATVDLYRGATAIGTATATGGLWTITPTGALAQGSHTLTATATRMGSTSQASTAFTLTIDTTAPNAPAVTSAALTNGTTPALAGTAEAGSTVTVTVGGATYTTTAAAGTGVWSVNLSSATPASGTLSLNANGTNTVSATATDAAGNVSAPGTQTLTVNTTNPNAPTVTSAALTNSATPVIGSTVAVTVGGATYTAIATGGTWRVDLTTATPTTGTLSLNPNGANPVSAIATDASGNVSAPGTQSLTIDTTAPTATVLFEDDSIDAIEQSSAAFTISGGEAGAGFTWTITSAGGG
ncbi:Ig-like domain-containing protein, partial [Azospirillum aestuarii]|uniref:Ig-like domain-containing protein n=1 Tax=Azospirillum aestuarii TaxID=2802052 RepID=UPI004054BFD8